MAGALQVSESWDDLIQKGKEEEEKGDLKAAAGYYEKAAKHKHVDDLPFDRLMIIYRKLKEPRNELKIINSGIRRYEEHYKKISGGNKKPAKKVSLLSDAFMKSTGLKDKKGNVVYTPQPISRWLKRKEIVEKKLK